jgi:pantetheine-phosphate adenylyltransferase
MQDLLDKWGIKIKYTTILDMWNEPHRHYHNQNHLLDLIDSINGLSGLSESEYEKLILCALFHDIIYDPSSQTNEEDSAQFFMSCVVDKKNPDIIEIREMILSTKSHQSESKLSKIFNDLDMSVIESDYENLLEWERGISNEFIPVWGLDNYKMGRSKFLESLLDKYPTNYENLSKLIKYVKSM